MFRAVVASRVRAAWAALQARRPEVVLDGLAAEFSHHFTGDHALGGTRTTRDSQARWFARLFTLLPDVEFTVRDVLVAGWPWRTRAVAIVDVRVASVPSYANTVVQLIELRWGKITRIQNHEDTQALAELLADRAREGQAEAAADPIV
jgi:ketosteroid isomerase-like protein